MIAKTFFGLEGVLADELAQLGAQDVQVGRRMVAFCGDRRLMYRANIHCRTAVRVLVPIASFSAHDERSLYHGVSLVDWLEHVDPDGSLAIDPVVHSPDFSNSLYAAQLAKDAIVDQFRNRHGRRPAVNLDDPKLRINLHIDRQRVTLYLDSSGDSLHKRGYRAAAGEAPINEVLAAGILRLSGWDAHSALADFMCGSGTFPIEAAMLARHIAPGTVRRQFGYMRWRDFEATLHAELMDEARRQQLDALEFRISGSDLDQRIIDVARQNARRAGVEQDIDWAVENFDTARPPAPQGTLITNPPYDERMKAQQITAVYRRIGDTLKHNWPGYTAFVLAGNAEAARNIGLRPNARVRLFNGPLECRLLKFVMTAPVQRDNESAPPRRNASDALDEFRNRLSRMARHWHRAARRQHITAYRLYDRDLPEVPVAVDWYAGHLLLTPYVRRHARTDIEQGQWLQRVLQVVGQTLEVSTNQISAVGLDRVPASGRSRGTREGAIEVQERDLRFEVHIGSTKSTGLPLDGRLLRARLQSETQGKRFLNLFAGSGSYAVAAAIGGAATTTSIESSQAAADWAARNLALNGIHGGEHRVICQDPLEFVAALDDRGGPAFDLALVQPPGFDGQRRAGIWNVQDGHVELLNRLLSCMAPSGVIYLVTTFRRLTLHAESIEGATVHEITRQTVPPDFRDRKVHRAWRIVRSTAS
jgi:23S rRNA (guanine2445-N2)-methyltransferase / 23S rRNA (guanine2069-N7)-methyltransferase